MAVMGRFIGVGVVLVLTGVAVADQPLSVRPTDTDLHAAYCMQTFSILIEAASHPLTGPEYSTEPQPNDPPALRESKAKLAASNREVKAILDTQKASLRRLNLYLKPRMFDLDPMPLVAAKRAAQEDWDRIGAVSTGCENQCPIGPDGPTDSNQKCHTECAARAMPDLPTIQKKIKSCTNLEWLPF